MPETALLQQRIANLFLTALKLDVPSIDSDLFDTGVLDSLAFVQLLFHLEEEFGVSTSVEDMEVENFKSISSIANFLAARGVGAVGPPAAR